MKDAQFHRKYAIIEKYRAAEAAYRAKRKAARGGAEPYFFLNLNEQRKVSWMTK